MRTAVACWALALVASVAWPDRGALAADHTNLEEGLPTDLTDAVPIGYLGREVQGFLRYQHDDGGAEDFLGEARLEFGFPRNAQISVSGSYRFGEVEPDGFQPTRLEGLYNFNQESRWLPSTALAAALDFPTGNDSHGFDPTVKAILTKTVPFTERFQQIHLNFEWRFNDDVQPDERSGGWRAIAGYSVRLGPQALGILDVLREVQLEDGHEQNIAEAGLRYQLTPLAVVSGAVGAGFGDESPDVRIRLGIQYSF